MERKNSFISTPPTFKREFFKALHAGLLPCIWRIAYHHDILIGSYLEEIFLLSP
jgi:hypothetical protein